MIVRRIEAISDELELLTPCVGHAGNGNIHFLPVVDTDDQTAMDRVQELTDAIVSAALELGGTATASTGLESGSENFQSPLSDFKEAVREAGLEDRVVYVEHGDTYRFEIPAARQ